MQSTESSKKGRFSRNKGARGEREIRDLFREAGFLARRSVGQNRSGSDAPDVLVEGIPTLWVEVKRGKRCNIKGAIEQARFQCKRGDNPIAVTKEDGEKANVTMGFEFFAFLMQKAYPEALGLLEEKKDGDQDQDG